MLQKALLFLFGVKVALVSCHFEENKAGLEKEKYRVEKLGKLDKAVNECSGLTTADQPEHLLALNDSGGEAVLYEVNKKGKLMATFPVPHARNQDWEELCRDDKGNIYIGDFGNNDSKREDLLIYKVTKTSTQKIQFSYPNRIKGKKEYDCEAFFWANDSLYLFTKSWESGVKVCRLYTLSDQEGVQVAQLKDEIWLKAQITAAALSPDKSQFALLSYGKLFLFGINEGNINFQQPQQCIKVARKQTEVLLYETPTRLIFSNEQGGLFRIALDR